LAVAVAVRVDVALGVVGRAEVAVAVRVDVAVAIAVRVDVEVGVEGRDTVAVGVGVGVPKFPDPDFVIWYFCEAETTVPL
jgi:hypothetical protein